MQYTVHTFTCAWGLRTHAYFVSLFLSHTYTHAHTQTHTHKRQSEPSRCFWLENTLQHLTRSYQQQRLCNLVSLSFAILFYFPHFKYVQSSHPLLCVNATASINNRRLICIYFHTILVNRGRSASYVPGLSSCDKGIAKYWMSLCAVCTCGLFTGFGVSCC